MVTISLAMSVCVLAGMGRRCWGCTTELSIRLPADFDDPAFDCRVLGLLD